jgi:hypothetical protein
MNKGQMFSRLGHLLSIKLTLQELCKKTPKNIRESLEFLCDFIDEEIRDFALDIEDGNYEDEEEEYEDEEE